LDDYAGNWKTVKWIFVYISEAHAISEWPISYTEGEKPINMEQTRDVDSREEYVTTFCTNVKNMVKYVSIPINDTDTPMTLARNFELVYKPWPLRIYGFEGKTLSFVSQPEECETLVERVFDWVAQ
jgi:hypothetical protein